MSNTPSAANCEFRGKHPTDSRKTIYLEQPELIRHFPDLQLQRKNADSTWDTFLLSENPDDDDQEVTGQE